MAGVAFVIGGAYETAHAGGWPAVGLVAFGAALIGLMVGGRLAVWSLAGRR